ncbi:GHKL domain-containing protein [Chitinophaga silvatica]|uniref:GHKL domain-containing protein n=1 Tax=Chitinophaga silvatica TaxID=2282649 RepID=A0A3E1Y7J8_9BACT|nr:histidine kinase [Chitinophaga silvatica]RFS21049.1 GHKL domain-containing protein [Chitinophaga silvatica]
MIDIPRLGLKKGSVYAIYWGFYILLFGFVQAGPRHDYKNAFASELISLPMRALFVAIVLEIMVEKLLFRKKGWLFILLYFPLILLFAVIQRWLDNALILQYFLTHWQKEPLFSVSPFIYSVIKLQFVVTIPISVKLFYNWIQEQHRATEISEEKAQAELVILRNQFHPHFIFNVLNTLYAKTLVVSPESAEMVSRMSSLLRFSIYEINERSISLDKEIKYLEDYIALQKARFDAHQQISFYVEGEADDKLIEPFILMTFVENAFKHCMPAEDGESWITITISVQQEWLTARIENSAVPSYSGHSLYSDGGVGLSNVRRRLNLIYGEDHTLKITQNDDCYFVYLKLKLELYGK